MKKILIIWTEGFDSPNPSNHLMSTLIEDMLDHGFKISLIQSRKLKTYDETPSNLNGKFNLEVITIERKVIDKNSFIKRYIEETFFHFKAFLRWRKVENIDGVIVGSCPTVIFSILILKIFTKLPILYSIQDMWPGSAVNSGVLRSKILSHFFYELQKVAYHLSDVLTVISQDMKNKVVEQGVKCDKIHSIFNWFDDRTVHEVYWEENRFVKKYNLSKQKFYVQYAGTMGYVFDYNMVVQVADKLRKYDDIEFHMIGQGSQKEKFMDTVFKKKLTNIRFFPLEPQDMVSDVYSACDICLIPLKKGIIGNSVPSKAGLLMACNRTIINSVDENSEYYNMFRKYKIGVAESNEDPDSVARAIIDLRNYSDRREEYARNGHDFGKKHFSRSENTKIYISVINNMLREK